MAFAATRALLFTRAARVFTASSSCRSASGAPPTTAASSAPGPRPRRRAAPHKPTTPPPAMQSRARVYADVNTNKPREYWDYEAVTVEWG